MSRVQRLVLDVLKPHQPNALEFARALAAIDESYGVSVKVLEVDEHTETVQVVLEAGALDFDRISAALAETGSSLHSIDEVSVVGE
jgi:hypothetical protein